MTGSGEQKPNDGRYEKPPKTDWEAVRKERFFDLKFSHFIELILTAILVGVGYLQYQVYTRQAGIMDRQVQISEADQRPWISFSNPQIASDLIFSTAGSASLTFGANIQNTGHLPADNILVSAQIYVPWRKTQQDTPSRARDKICSTDPTPLPPPPEIAIQRGTVARGYVLFPADKIPFEYTGTIDSEVVKDMREASAYPATWLAVVACLDYKFIFKDDRHQTSHIFLVHTLGSDGSHQSIPMTDETIPRSRLQISWDPTGTTAN